MLLNVEIGWYMLYTYLNRKPHGGEAPRHGELQHCPVQELFHLSMYLILAVISRSETTMLEDIFRDTKIPRKKDWMHPGHGTR